MLAPLAFFACRGGDSGNTQGAPAAASALAASASAPAPSSSAPDVAACPPLRLELPPLSDPTFPPRPGAAADASDGIHPAHVDIVDDNDALTRFFERTALLLRGRATAPVRIAVYGDSNGTMDYMTGEMRRLLQTAHGDAGHGFVALARPWPWYRHQYVVSDYNEKAWSAFTVTTHPTPAMDPWYGPGLIVAQSKQAGAATWVETAPEGVGATGAGAPGAAAAIGTHASHFEVWYLLWPPGGAFDVKVDGEVRASVDTHADGDPHFGFVAVDVPDGPHKMVALTRTPRPVRLLGAVVERDAPGFQVDGLGVASQKFL